VRTVGRRIAGSNPAERRPEHALPLRRRRGLPAASPGTGEGSSRVVARPRGKSFRSVMKDDSFRETIRKSTLGIVGLVHKSIAVVAERRRRPRPQMIVTQSTATTTQSVGTPTEEAPDVGRVVAAGVTLSEGMHWLEDGAHVIRSTEFELIGEGDDLDEAVRNFVGHALDLLAFLNDEIERGEATEHEVRVAGVLGARLGQAYRQVSEDREATAKQRERSTRLSFARRHKRQRLNAWHSHPTGNYSHPSDG
jgi:hypothetical protein